MPSVLHVAGGLDRLRALEGPTVAIVGTRTASDYGMEVAHGLARGLATSGVTVLSGLADGIAAAAHAGALEAGGPTITVMTGGVDVCHPVRRRALHQRVCDAGCALAELPCGQPPRGWCHTARARIVVALARVVIVVEARERVGELVYARLSRDTGHTLAAVPGRLGSPVASGPHALLRKGAQLVRDAGDVLEMLYEDGGPLLGVARPSAGSPPPAMEPGLRAVLDQVGAGARERETLVALARLELEGALARGDGGRYVARV
jgi:DNA processing protein